MRGNVRRVSGQNTKWTEDLLDIGKRDVLLVFDVRRYQHDVITFAETASNQGAKVILFPGQNRNRNHLGQCSGKHGPA
jgi:DNA-binding MurR/RpiR family transcriptional regulator